jgi:hypothetical protein
MMKEWDVAIDAQGGREEVAAAPCEPTAILR